MKLEGYEYLTTFAVPNYWYEEGDKKEHYWADSLNLYYYKIFKWLKENEIINDKGEHILDENNNAKKDPRKYYIIAPYKPIGTIVTKDNAKDLIKWLVEECYLDNDDINYEYYEWDFDNHCIKLD